MSISATFTSVRSFEVHSRTSNCIPTFSLPENTQIQKYPPLFICFFFSPLYSFFPLFVYAIVSLLYISPSEQVYSVLFLRSWTVMCSATFMTSGEHFHTVYNVYLYCLCSSQMCFVCQLSVLFLIDQGAIIADNASYILYALNFTFL